MTAPTQGSAKTRNSASFWDAVAHRYAAMPIRNPDSYEQTLELIRAHMKASDRVLELGCGTGTTATRLAEHVEGYVATDISAEMIAIASDRVAECHLKNVEARVAGPGDMSMPNGPFDMVVALNVVHLLPDRLSALADVAQRLRPGGLFISKTPCLSGAWRLAAPLVAALHLIGKAPYFRFLSVQRLERDIIKAGFDIIERGDYPKRPPRHFVVARKT